VAFIPPQALYLIVMDVAREDEEEVDRWNAEEHMAERLACPGFRSASRYRVEPDGRPRREGERETRARHLTMYELDDPRALHSETYAARTGGTASEWTKRVAPRLDVQLREVYVRTGFWTPESAQAGRMADEPTGERRA
jgi:hypothetical protein